MSKAWKIVLIVVAVVVLAILGKISADDRKIPASRRQRPSPRTWCPR
jgi:hypothetical protein